MRYIQSFSNSGAVQTALNEETLGKPYIAYVESESAIDWNSLSPVPPTPSGYTNMPLTFEILTGGTILWIKDGTTPKTIEYSINGSEWSSITSTVSSSTINVASGDTVQFRGDNESYSGNIFRGTATFNVYGNIMSLIDSTGFTTATTLSSELTFFELFLNNRGLISAEHLILPATTITYMCYWAMFQGCTSLTTAPELPATTLANGCYYRMFQGCTSLTTAPELPATTLADSCYNQMFYGCTNLNYIKCLATDITASICTNAWVDGVASAGTFVGNSSTNWSFGENGIPEGWASNVDIIKSSVSNINLAEQFQETTFDITSTQDWSATTIPSWVSLSQTAGTSGITTITITATTIPATEVQDSLIISTASKTASITITNTQQTMTPFLDWFAANEEQLMDGENVNLCQTFYIKEGFTLMTDFRVTGITTGEWYDVGLHYGSIDIDPNDNITKTETEIDGEMFWAVDFNEIIVVNDDIRMEQLKEYCEDEINMGENNPIYLE